MSSNANAPEHYVSILYIETFVFIIIDLLMKVICIIAAVLVCCPVDSTLQQVMGPVLASCLHCSMIDLILLRRQRGRWLTLTNGQ